MRWSLDGLEALAAVVDAGSFAAAAARLHKTQSAVSYAIGQLEAQLGVALFDRSGHRAVLTPTGQAVLEEARAVLSRARRLDALARRFDQGWEPRLHVIVDGVLPTRPVMVALVALERAGVPTRVGVRTEFLGGVGRRFEADDADLMVTLTAPDGRVLVGRSLPPEPLRLVAHPDHALFARPSSRGPHTDASLRDHLEVSVHDSSDGSRGVDTNTIGGARAFYVSDFRTKQEALRLGLGFGWLPERLALPDLAAGALRAVPYVRGGEPPDPSADPFAPWVLAPWLVARADRPLGPAAQRFRDELIAAWEASDQEPAAPGTPASRIRG